MSAKKNGAQAKSNPMAAPAVATAAPAPAPAADTTPWIESTDPRRRTIGKIVLVVVWVYVAALCLLAIDQWFNLGIFGPKIPPVP